MDVSARSNFLGKRRRNLAGATTEIGDGMACGDVGGTEEVFRCLVPTKSFAIGRHPVSFNLAPVRLVEWFVGQISDLYLITLPS